jgi:hypothetical protein
MEEILVDELPAEERQVQRASPGCMMNSKAVLKVLQGGTTGFATEGEIRECFIEAGYTGAGDDNDNDEEENTDDEKENTDDEEENTDDEKENTNN